MTPTLAPTPVTENLVATVPQPSVAPINANPNPLNAPTQTPVTQAQGADLSRVPGVQEIMSNLVAASNGQLGRDDLDFRDGQQFVVDLGNGPEVATLEPRSPEGNSSVFALVSSGGQTLATFVVEYNSDAEPKTHVATVRPSESVTLTSVATQDFGSAAAPTVDQTLTALATAYPPRSSHPNQASLPPGSVVTDEVDVDGGTLQIIQGEGRETRTHNSTEIVFNGDNGERLYLKFVRTGSGNFSIQEAYDMSGDGRKPPSTEQINNVMRLLETLSVGANSSARTNRTTASTTDVPSPSPVLSQDRRTFRDIFQGVSVPTMETLERSANLDESQMSFDNSRARGILVYPNQQTVEFDIQRVTPETTRTGSDLASDYLRMVQSFQNLIGERLPGHVVTAVSIFPEQSHPTGSNFAITISDGSGSIQTYNRESLNNLIQERSSGSPSVPSR